MQALILYKTEIAIRARNFLIGWENFDWRKGIIPDK